MKQNYNFQRYFLLLILFLFTTAAFAQQASISGKVNDDKGEPLTGAIIELRRVSDSVLVKANVSDFKGDFLFENQKEGNYYLRISMLGFKSYRTENFTYDGSTTKIIPAIGLGSGSVTLS